MPSDIVGFTMLDSKSGDFIYREGAVICNFLLADEINRASPKVQSALLEAMEERQISLDGTTHQLPKPFLVMATQNPVETYGTFHLPEAQMDRFFMKLSMGYPSVEEEIKILERTELHNPIRNIQEPVMHVDDVVAMQEEVQGKSIGRGKAVCGQYSGFHPRRQKYYSWYQSPRKHRTV